MSSDLKISQMTYSGARPTNAGIPWVGGVPTDNFRGNLLDLTGVYANFTAGDRALAGVPTASWPVAGGVYFVVNGGAIYPYLARAGTDAQNVPNIIRPTDYAAGTNEVVYDLLTFYTDGVIVGNGSLTDSTPGLVIAAGGAGNRNIFLNPTGIAGNVTIGNNGVLVLDSGAAQATFTAAGAATWTGAATLTPGAGLDLNVALSGSGKASITNSSGPSLYLNNSGTTATVSHMLYSSATSYGQLAYSPAGGANDGLILNDGRTDAQAKVMVKLQSSEMARFVAGNLLIGTTTNFGGPGNLILGGGAITAAGTNNLALTGGNSGASLVLGQGASGRGMLTNGATNITDQLVLVNGSGGSTTRLHLGQFGSGSFIYNNYYFTGSANATDDASKPSNGIQLDTSGDITFQYAAASATPSRSALMSLKNTGNLLIGTTTDLAAYKLNVYGATSANVIAANGVTPDGTKTGGTFTTVLGGTGAATGAYALAGDIAGRFVMDAYGNNFVYEAGAIQSTITTGGNADRNLHVAALDFQTKPTGSNAVTTVARLTGTGNLLIGTTTDSGARVSALKAGTSPASSGTTSTAAFRAFDSNNVALDVGVKSDASPFPGWIQVHDTANQAINYPLSLQGNGSYVTIGTLASATVGNGGLYVGGTAASTSTTSGALQVGGGIGVAGAINAGGQVNASRPFMSTGPIQSNMTSAGGIGFAGGGAYIYSFGADAATVGAFAVQQISSDGSVTRTPLSIATTGTATFSGAVTTGGMLTLPKAPAAGRSFIVTGVDGTGTGSLVIQAGGGSSSWGGTLNLFEAAHATRGGWATVGIGVSNAKFTVNSGGFADGGDVLTVDRTGVLSTTSYHDMTGGIGTPTAGHGQFGGSGAYGAVLAGNGSAYDFGLFNKNGTDVMHVATGGTTVAFSGTAPSTGVGTGALQVTGGIYAGAASVFGSTVTLGANLEMLGGANLRFAGAGGGLFYTSGYGQPISIQSSALNLNTLSGGVTTFGGVSILKNYTVATLPAAASYTYGEAYVSDATQAAGTSIGSAPTGGGSVVRGVYSNGSAWLLR